MAEGMFRDDDWAQVGYGKHAFPIPRKDYEEKGYSPPFLELPTKDEFLIWAQGVKFGDNA